MLHKFKTTAISSCRGAEFQDTPSKSYNMNLGRLEKLAKTGRKTYTFMDKAKLDVAFVLMALHKQVVGVSYLVTPTKWGLS